MADYLDHYRLSKEEIQKLRQDYKEAINSPKYQELLKQIKPMDLSIFNKADDKVTGKKDE